MSQDITANRHRGNPESVAAQKSRNRSAAQQRARVLEEIRRAKTLGLSSDELATKWGVGVNVVSGRFSELKAGNRIVKIGTRPTRLGRQAAVYVATER